MEKLEQGDIILCTVDRIVGTTVFVKIHVLGKEIEGSIVLSEIAPGRIRNLRDYVIPNKKIVCKVLKVSGEQIELSLRRVTQKEQKEVKEQYKQEKSYEKIFKSILGDKLKEVMDRILEEGRLYDFIEEIKSDQKSLEKLVGKKDAEKIFDIINKQKNKKAVVKEEILMTTTKPDGVKVIKEILGKIKDAQVKYISGGRYMLKAEADNIKTADHNIKEIIKQLEEESRKKDINFSVKK